MILKKVELWNFRCHEHLEFVPDENGITSVSGVNGAGKSSIVDGFAWSLYGTKPNNAKSKLLIREGVSTKDEKVQVESTIAVDKTEYLIRRRLVTDSGGADCNVYGRPLGTNAKFNHLAGPAISSAETFIKQTLKMDEKGFLTAIFIQQKQVDQIVTSSPRERGEVIEKLTGIQSITNGIDLAREEARTYQKAASVITVDDTDSIKLQIEEVMKEGKQSRLDQKKTEELISKGKETIKLAKDDYEQSEKANQKSHDLTNSLNLMKAEKRMLSNETKELETLILEYKKETKSTITTNIHDLQDNVNKKNKEIANLESRISSITKEKKVLDKTISELKVIPQSEEELLVNKKSLLKEIEKLMSQNEKEKERISAISGEEKQIKKSLNTLSSDDSECPVCKSHIDDPVKLKEEIKRELSLLKEDEKSLKKSNKEVVESIVNKKNEIINIDSLIEKLTNLSETKNRLISLNNELDNLTEKLSDTQLKHKVLYDKYIVALEIQSRANEVDRAKTKLVTGQEKLDKLNKEIEEKESLLDSLNAPTDRSLAGKRNKIDEWQRKLNKLTLEQGKREERISFLAIRVKDLTKNYESAKAAKTKYDNLVTSMKRASVSASLLAKFKEERIKYSIPSLEMYASTVLNKFTDGKFVKLSLDAKFNTSVTLSTGEVRPITQLSGGELSAAAIALRIGISMLLNDGSHNVLILDEILVSMDAVRARHIIETINSITNCQVIFIAHNPDIQEVADKNVVVG